MINIGVGPNIFLGLVVIIASLVLYFLRTIKYNLSRDIDIFFATLGLIYGSIMIIHGWRLDPILLFSQILLIVLLFSVGWENIRMRGLISFKDKEISSYQEALSNWIDHD
jgi:hypothetical protein